MQRAKKRIIVDQILVAYDGTMLVPFVLSTYLNVEAVY
jgi:hypothetical protein